MLVTPESERVNKKRLMNNTYIIINDCCYVVVVVVVVVILTVHTDLKLCACMSKVVGSYASVTSLVRPLSTWNEQRISSSSDQFIAK